LSTLQWDGFLKSHFRVHDGKDSSLADFVRKAEAIGGIQKTVISLGIAVIVVLKEMAFLRMEHDRMVSST